MSMEETNHKFTQKPYSGPFPDAFMQGLAEHRARLRKVYERGGGGEYREMLRRFFQRMDQDSEERGIGREN
jgi:hypothetical protein